VIGKRWNGSYDRGGKFPDRRQIVQMIVRRWLFGSLFFAVIIIIASPAFSSVAHQDQTAQPQAQAPGGTPTANLPPESQAPQGSAPLRVMVGKSLLINTTERIKRLSVTDPGIAYAQPITPTQILVHGKAPGEVSLLIWDELERSRSFDLRVDVDVSACADEEHRVFPDEQITVTPSRAAVVLSGHVSTEDVAKRAGELASAYSPKVVNVLTFGPVGSQEVLLQVKFVEVDRSAITQLGVNFLSNGLGNTIGAVGTGQYGGFGPVNVQTQQTTSALGGTATQNTGIQTISNFLRRKPGEV
jgi:pilus assembly protein CpaC